MKGRALAHEGSDENPPAREKISRVASLEAAVPLKLGAGVLDTGLRGSRSTTVDDVSGSRDVLDTIALTGRTLIGQTSLAANAGWSQSVKSAGDRKRDLEFVLSLSRPVIDKLLQAGLDAKATDSRSFERDSGEVKSLKDALRRPCGSVHTAPLARSHGQGQGDVGLVRSRAQIDRFRQLPGRSAETEVLGIRALRVRTSIAKSELDFTFVWGAIARAVASQCFVSNAFHACLLRSLLSSR